MSDKPEAKPDVEPVVLNLQDLVPKPRPEIFTLLGAIEAGIKQVREALEEVPNQPNALTRITTVKAACISIEALLQQQITDTIMKVQAVSIADQLSNLLDKDGKAKPEDVKAATGKGSGYL